MQTEAKYSQNPTVAALGNESNGGEAMGEKSAGSPEGKPGKLREATPIPASTRSGQHVGKCGETSRTDAEGEWSGDTRFLTDEELADAIEGDWGITNAGPK